MERRSDISWILLVIPLWTACQVADPRGEFDTTERLSPGAEEGPISSEDAITERGYTLERRGRWVRNENLRASRQGWSLLDLDYLSPAEDELAAQGLFPCGPDWMPLEDADDYHSRLLRWWKTPSLEEAPLFAAYSTCSRETTLRALSAMGGAALGVERLFGVRPELPAAVILLRSNVQYNAFAASSAEAGSVPPESSGLSAIHYSFLCDTWFDEADQDRFVGAACCYWDDSTSGGEAWGPFAARHAAALAWVEALDPSPAALRRWRASSDRTDFPSQEFWAEKRIPSWLRYGAAGYCERFFVDPSAEDPLGVRRWSLDELRSSGALFPLETLFQFDVNPREVGHSRKLLLQAGAVVAFLLDGGDDKLTASIESLHLAMKGEGSVEEAIQRLESQLLESTLIWTEFMAVP